MFFNFAPTSIPGVSASTTKPVIRFPAEASGSVTASTKYHPPLSCARPPFVIHVLEPLITYSSPFLSALVCIAATSLPAPGSLTPYAACIGASNKRPKYLSF